MIVTINRTTEPEISIVEPVDRVFEINRVNAPDINILAAPDRIISIQRNGLAGPPGPQGQPGAPGQNGAAQIPEILDGGNF